jgi:predicted phosphodiesterase
VDLVVSGHTHSYQHAQLNGVHYVMVGGAGGALDTFCAGDWPFFDYTADVHGYSVMDVNGPTLTWNSYNENDGFLHSFQIVHP